MDLNLILLAIVQDLKKLDETKFEIALKIGLPKSGDSMEAVLK